MLGLGNYVTYQLSMIPKAGPHEMLTDRLLLRRWTPADLGPYAAINADAHVMEYFPKTFSTDETSELIQRKEEAFRRNGFGFWAVELLESHEMIGTVGLGRPRFEAHFTPCVEIGWRIAAHQWGNGYAPEAARKVLELAFGPLDIPKIFSFTAALNLRSRRVMEKIGMSYEGEFDHPWLDAASPLKRHTLFRILKPAE